MRTSARRCTAATSARTCARGIAASRSAGGTSRSASSDEPHVSLVDWLRAGATELAQRYDRLYVPRNDARWLRRNALVAAGNSGGDAERGAVEEYAEHEDELLREHAAWALARLAERGV